MLKMIYVTMTDKFLSGWGIAKNQIAKLVIVCETWEQAEIVAENAKNRSDMKSINFSTEKPYYNQNKYQVEYHDINSYPRWFEKDYF